MISHSLALSCADQPGITSFSTKQEYLRRIAITSLLPTRWAPKARQKVHSTMYLHTDIYILNILFRTVTVIIMMTIPSMSI